MKQRRVLPLFLAICTVVGLAVAAMAAFLDRGILAAWMAGGAIVAATVWMIFEDS